MSLEEFLKIRRNMIALYEAQLDSYQSMLARAKEQGCHDLAKFPEFIELTDFIVAHATENHEIELLWSEMPPELQEKVITTTWELSPIAETGKELLRNKTKVTILLTATHNSLAILKVRANGEYCFEDTDKLLPIKPWLFESQYRLSFFPETPFKDKIKS